MSDLEKILNQFLDSSRETALKDGIINEKEAALLETIKLELDQIGKEIKELLPDMDLPRDELERRVKLVSRGLLNTLTAKAKEDNKIDKDEMAILSTIIEKLT
ncbi:MAG: hypothetical protein INQ03_00215 [Candidatus Heimdallarchaeota archaeon]|nr:hypothetical protein [Candidatus Heimdallarchaeota archaeon]